MACYYILVFFVVVNFVNSEVVKFESCENYSRSRDLFRPDDCTIHEVRVDPCPDAAYNNPCTMKKFSNFTLSIDFTPHFRSEKIDVAGTWPKKFTATNLFNVRSNGCKDTVCPVQQGVRQMYRTRVTRLDGKSSSKNPYTARWALLGEHNHVCCVTFKIKLRPADSHWG